MRRVVSIVLGALLLAGTLPQVAFALSEDELRDMSPTTTTTDGMPADIAAPSVGGGSILRFVVGLAIVLCIIFALRWVLKRTSLGRVPGIGGEGAIRVLETKTLAPHRYVHLVRVGEQLVVVGSSESGVAYLGQVSDTVTVDLLNRIDAVPAGAPAPTAPLRVIDALRDRTTRN